MYHIIKQNLFRSSKSYQEDCQIIEVPYEFATTKTGFSLQKNSPYLQLFDYYIIRLQERGILERIVKKYTPQPRDCNSSSAKAIGYESCFFAFLLLLLGYLFGILLLIIENYWRRRECKSEYSRKIAVTEFKQLVQDYNLKVAELKMMQDSIIEKSQILKSNMH